MDTEDYKKGIFDKVNLLTFISCSTNSHDNSFDKFITKLDRIKIKDSLRIKFDNSPVHKSLKLTANEKGQIVVVDASNWTLHLMDKEGNFIDRTGGIGRGPNEYIAINQIHIRTDNRLYVYDAKSQDVTIYSILNNKFHLIKEILLPAYEKALFLESIYKTTNGYVGVFKPLTNPQNKENNFKVYRLGKDLQLKKLLFEMPGNETYISQGVEIDNPLGFKTNWDITDDHFYYSTSNNLSVTLVSVQNGSSKKVDLSKVPRSVKGEKEIAAIKSRLSLLIQQNSQIMELIQEGQYLPYFLNFTVSQDYFYYSLFTPGGTHGILLRFNRTTGEFSKIGVPSVFNLYAVRENTLYGIDFTTIGAPEIVILKLES